MDDLTPIKRCAKKPAATSESRSIYSLSLTVGERDALRGHLEVDGGGGGQRVGGQRLADGLGDGLRPREGLHVH